MNGFDVGRTRVAFAEKVGQGGRVGSTFAVYIDREARLAANLGAIESTLVRFIAVVIHPGFADERIVMLKREDAAELRDALDQALRETVLEEFAP